ncbi:MAG: radical SAM protein [Nitrospirota bacterium]
MGTPGHLLHLARMYWRYAVVRSARVPYSPVRLWVEMTNACNLKCVMCPTSLPSAPKPGMMEPDLFRKIVDEASAFAYDMAVHHRGESTLHPEFAPLLAYAARKGIRTKLHTNGAAIDAEKAEAVVRSGLDYLSFSFDGFEKEAYERIRVRGSFEKTLGNIVEFLRVKKSLGSRKPYTVIEVIDFPSMGNVDPDARRLFVERFRDLPLDELRIKAPHNWAGSYDASKVPSKRRFVPCTFPWFALVIFWDGTAVTCPQDFFGAYPLGNVRDASLMEIWRGDALRRLREDMLARRVEHYSACSACDVIYRPTFAGVPTPNLRRFLTDQILGYGRRRRGFGTGRSRGLKIVEEA